MSRNLKSAPDRRTRAAGKISREFVARLEGRLSEKVVRVILLASTEPRLSPTAGRLSESDRRAAVKVAERSVDVLLDEIEQVLTKFGGRRVPSRLGAIGGVTVETTPEGIKALARSSHVRAILEDQAIALVDGS